MDIGNRRETMTMLDERSQTVVQQWISGTDVKQWRCWMNGHKQWFSNGYREHVKQWRCWMNSHKQWFSNGYREHMKQWRCWMKSQTMVQQWISGTCETMTMLDERSQTQSTLVITYSQGCPVKIVYIWRPLKLRYKVTLIPFKLCLFQFYCFI